MFSYLRQAHQRGHMDMTKHEEKLIRTTLVLIFLLLLAGCGGAKGGGPAGGMPEVAVVTIQPERVVLTTDLPGRISAHLVAEVRPQVSGIIQNRFFTEGSDVRAGEVLYQIDPATYEAAYAGAKAALARAEGNVASIRNRAQRYKELAPTNAVSKQDLDDVLAALAQAEAEIEANKAATEVARINLAYTKVKSPISGRIGKSNVTVGALVTANQPNSLAVVQQLDPIYVDATQSSANLLQLKRNLSSGKISNGGKDGAKVKLILEDGMPYLGEGSLKFSDVTVDPSTGSLILRMVFPNPKHTLLPGMYVRAVVQEGLVTGAILAPQQGVSRDPKGNPIALIVTGENKVEARLLTLDRVIGNRWLVAQGLKAGDRLIVEGLQKVRPGASVKAVPFDADGKGGPGTAKTVQTPAKTP
jgi:membrane fusion protein, multidrug efflux system